ncbi:thiamine pyrophosphate-dependent enzyme, partial [Escherichia coli]|uniref:thiamine pyrophosphate-dependent enzyme n=1 Tax=Escherichia coli TaxID=562 RepID=UPI003F2075E4
LHFECYRYVEHVGIAEDFDQGYRSRDELEPWSQRDPIRLVRARLAERGVTLSALDRIDLEIDRELAAAVELARKAPFPDAAELETDVLA